MLSLRGPEVILPDLGGLASDVSKEISYIIIALRAKLKGEKDEWNHLFPAVEVFKSGIPIK